MRETLPVTRTDLLGAALIKQTEAAAEVEKLEANFRKAVAATVQARMNPGVTAGGLGNGKHVFAKRLEARERLRAINVAIEIIEALFEEHGR